MGLLRPLYESCVTRPRGQAEKAKGKLLEAALRAEAGLLVGDSSLAELRLQRLAAPQPANTGWEEAQPPEQSRVSKGISQAQVILRWTAGPRGIAAGDGTERPLGLWILAQTFDFILHADGCALKCLEGS